MEIYERKDFKKLGHWFWIGFNKKNNENIINTGYPLILIRVVISKLEEDSYKSFHDLNESSEIKGVFYSEFTDGPFHVGMFINTIEYYITDKLENWDCKTPYELLKNNPK